MRWLGHWRCRSRIGWRGAVDAFDVGAALKVLQAKAFADVGRRGVAGDLPRHVARWRDRYSGVAAVVFDVQIAIDAGQSSEKFGGVVALEQHIARRTAGSTVIPTIEAADSPSPQTT